MDYIHNGACFSQWNEQNKEQPFPVSYFYNINTGFVRTDLEIV